MMTRYFSHYCADPHFNMAFDEWMFEQALARDGSLYIRLYTWDSPAITFGFNQIYERAVDLSRLGGLPAIRRVTGGRALLHDPSELTYALALNTNGADDFSRISPRELYAQITDMLMDFLIRVGVQCRFVRQSSPQNSRPEFFHKTPCFASLARYEIVSDGQKIVASAQRLVESTVFQHGSIKIGGVASHSAIAFGSGARRDPVDLHPISEQAFRDMEQQFARAFEPWMGSRPAASHLTEGENQSLLNRFDLVRKNCVEKRDIFKQK